MSTGAGMSPVEITITYENRGKHTQRPLVYVTAFLQTRDDLEAALAALDAMKHLLPNKEEEK